MGSRRVIERILFELGDREMSNGELAKRMNISPGYVSHILSGRNSLTAKNAIGLQRVLGLNARDLLIMQVEDELEEALEESTHAE